MKLAVLFQGKIRSPETSIKNCIELTKKQLKNYDCYFYGFTWTGINVGFLNEHVDCLLTENEVYEDFLDSINWPATMNVRNHDEYRKIHRVGSYAYVHSCDAVLNDVLKKFGLNHFDAFLRIRNDLFLETNYDLWIETLKTDPNLYITTKNYWCGVGLNDHVTLVTFNNALKIFHNNMNSWKKCMMDAWNSEKAFEKMVQNQNMPVHIIDVDKYIIKRQPGHPGCDEEGNWILKT